MQGRRFCVPKLQDEGDLCHLTGNWNPAGIGTSGGSHYLLCRCLSDHPGLYLAQTLLTVHIITEIPLGVSKKEENS